MHDLEYGVSTHYVFFAELFNAWIFCLGSATLCFWYGVCISSVGFVFEATPSFELKFLCVDQQRRVSGMGFALRVFVLHAKRLIKFNFIDVALGVSAHPSAHHCSSGLQKPRTASLKLNCMSRFGWKTTTLNANPIPETQRCLATFRNVSSNEGVASNTNPKLWMQTPYQKHYVAEPEQKISALNKSAEIIRF